MNLEIATAVCAGIGLSAATGFRVFVPFLVASLASRVGWLTLAPDFAWIASDPALIAFAAATAVEIAAYFIPWLDNALDTIATPAAVVAGIVLASSLLGDVSPFLRWLLAAVAGGGVAGLVQTATVFTRGASTVTTAGLANPLVAAVELGAAAVLSIAAVLLPVLAAAAAVIVIVVLVRRRTRNRMKGEL